MKIVFFDIGSTSGWAHNCTPDQISHGQMDFTRSNGRPARLWATFEAFDAFLRGLMVDAVVFERPFARGQHATRSLWGQAGILEAVATRRGFPIVDVTPAELKKFATGKGDATKEEMIRAAKDLFWRETPDLLTQNIPDLQEHEADAICGLFYSLKHVSKVIPHVKRKK